MSVPGIHWHSHKHTRHLNILQSIFVCGFHFSFQTFSCGLVTNVHNKLFLYSFSRFLVPLFVSFSILRFIFVFYYYGLVMRIQWFSEWFRCWFTMKFYVSAFWRKIDCSCSRIFFFSPSLFFFSAFFLYWFVDFFLQIPLFSSNSEWCVSCLLVPNQSDALK